MALIWSIGFFIAAVMVSGMVPLAASEKKVIYYDGLSDGFADRNGFLLQTGQEEVFLEHPLPEPESSMTGVFVLESKSPELRGFDGVVQPGPGVLPLEEYGPLDLSAFPSFAFFQKEPTTIGFVMTFAGASGGSTQHYLFIDQETRQWVRIGGTDYSPLKWEEESFPPDLYRYQRSFSLGPGMLSLGSSNRLTEVREFYESEYVTNPDKTLRYWEKALAKVELSEPDLREIRQQEWQSIDRETAVRFLDFVYYGLLTGKETEVQEFLESVTPELKQEVRFSGRFLPYLDKNPQPDWIGDEE